MFRHSSLRKYAFLPLALSLLLAGCEKTETAPGQAAAPAAPTPTPGPKSATPNSFDEVTAQLDPGGDFYLYLSTRQWLGRLSQGIDRLSALALSGTAGNQSPQDRDKAEKGFALLKDIVHKSGLEEISGIGASSFAVSPGLHRNKIFIHHYPAEGSGLLWSICGRDPHPLTGLDMLPVDTAWASMGDFDLAQLIDFLRQEAAQSGIPEVQQAAAQWQTRFAGVSGLKLDDVLASLNGSMGMVITLDASSTISVPVNGQPQSIPAPRLAILLSVQNDLLFKQVDKMASGNPGVVKVDEPDLRMRTMPVPFIPALNLRPSVAQWNGYLIIATDDKLIREMVAVQKGAPGYKSTPEYATLSAGLPQQGDSFAVSTRRFSETMRKFQGMSFANQPQPNPAQAAMIRQWISSVQKVGAAYGVALRLPNGRLCISQTSFSSP